MSMERIGRIIAHPLWQEKMEAIQRCERKRIFCRHGTQHLLDVARLAYIEALERGLDMSVEEIYAAALLHDIGRAEQYENGLPHHEASAALAAEILPECGFTETETAELLGAISAHRSAQAAEDGSLMGLLYRADKASRLCWACKAEKDCNWSEHKKNKKLTR